MEIYNIEGLSCASCAASAQKILGRTKGVGNVRVNYATKTAAIAVEQETIGLDGLNDRLSKLGFKLYPKSRTAHKERQEREQKALHTLKMQLIRGSIFVLPLFVIAMFMPEIPNANFIMFGLTLPILWWSGRHFFSSAFKQATVLKANMDTLVALGTGTAFLFSTFNTFFPFVLESYGIIPHVYFEAVGVLLVFVLLGKYLEAKASRQTSSAIEALLAMQVPTVQLLEEGVEKKMPIEVIQLGDVLKIRPGDVIPLDGKIIEGTAHLDESMLTGESKWISKRMGDEVLAGTILQQGSFLLEVTRGGEDTVLAQIITLVEQAQSTQVPIQKLVDKIAAVFVPVVILIALMTFVFWLTNGLWVEGLVNAVAVLVVACPCALGLATPTAITIGIGEAAKRGILIRNIESLERISKIDAIVLDKTGTITEGKPEITQMDWKAGSTRDLEETLLALENESEHPIAQAIVHYYEKKGITAKEPVHNFANYTGLGLKGTVKGVDYWLGNKQLMEQEQISIAPSLQKNAQKYEQEGCTLVFFATKNAVLAVLGLNDVIKERSAEAIFLLKKEGKKIYMLTGDNEGTARRVAKKVGIQNYQANVMPQDKIAFVQELQQRKEKVMMVGDGVNDAPALAQADVGIAMNNGTSVAIESADVVLRNNDLEQLGTLANIASDMLRIIRQNLFWAFIYNIILIPVAAGILYPWGILLNPMVAGGAMALSSVFVVMNSLRLKQYK
ncbi:heavy metal translocating P-type ATPase [Aureispira anguillae]|uniref:Heavy metal translocating P-type ATPase n=1 Tax=Aureispira anguillae TaxID=2864201 RepID=A0A915YIP7_9BACT|nr:heavy metal translocating P-type ATPase [Aureispira anguillae]BDS13696.1 heavy metal translocating P-type ATPase [Aureispira anguillae]